MSGWHQLLPVRTVGDNIVEADGYELVVWPGPEIARIRGSADPYVIGIDGKARPLYIEHINPGELDRNLTVSEDEEL